MPADHKQVAQDLIRDDPRGRCAKHRDTPGPSLYFDCCESERLREGWQRTEAALAATRSALTGCVKVLERLEWRGPTLESCPFCFSSRRDGHMKELSLAGPPCVLATALARARETGVG